MLAGYGNDVGPVVAAAAGMFRFHRTADVEFPGVVLVRDIVERFTQDWLDVYIAAASAGTFHQGSRVIV